MSKMAELAAEIVDHLRDGVAPVDVARQMNVPVKWVWDLESLVEDDGDDQEAE